MLVRRAVCLIAIGTGMAGVLACSLVLETEDGQCEVDSDCEARGGEFAGSVCVDRTCIERVDPRFSCLGKVVWPAPGSNTITMTQRIQELLSEQPPKNLMVTACDKLDVDCGNPVAGPTGPNAEGNVALVVPSGFDGFLRMLSDDTLPGYLNNIEPAFEDYVSPVPINLFTPGGFNLLVASGGFTYDPALGFALILGRDCTGETTAGLSFRTDIIDKQTQGFYLKAGLPTPTAQETDKDGQGGFLNLPTGYVTFTSSIAATGQLVGKATVTIRANSVSYIDIPPTP